MYCRKCGRQIGQSTFCRYCGAERSDASVSFAAASGAVLAMPVASETSSLKKPDASAIKQQAVESSAAVSWYEAPDLGNAPAKEVDSRAKKRSELLDTVIGVVMVVVAIAALVAVFYFSSISSSAEDGSHGWENPYEGTWRIGAMYLIDSQTFEVEQSGEASGTIEIADNEMFVNAETSSGEKLLNDEASFVEVDADVCAYESEDGAVWIVSEMGDGSGISAICMVDSAEQYLAFGMFYDTE